MYKSSSPSSHSKEIIQEAHTYGKNDIEHVEWVAKLIRNVVPEFWPDLPDRPLIVVNIAVLESSAPIISMLIRENGQVARLPQ
jgi:hypothetical protein